MAFSWVCMSPEPSLNTSLAATIAVGDKFRDQTQKKSGSVKCLHLHSNSPPMYRRSLLHKSAVPLVAASISVFLWSSPVKAGGFLSGFSGIESIPGPQLPQIDFLTRLNEENQKKYAEADARFKESPLLKQLLERSKQNKEKNRKEIEDKYCLRGAEWGVGDCSAEGMTPEDRDSFISMLKQKAGVHE